MNTKGKEISVSKSYKQTKRETIQQKESMVILPEVKM